MSTEDERRRERKPLTAKDYFIRFIVLVVVPIVVAALLFYGLKVLLSVVQDR